jgi:hypothetical protein
LIIAFVAVAATLIAFRATEGEPTVWRPGPEFPAEMTKSAFVSEVRRLMRVSSVP